MIADAGGIPVAGGGRMRERAVYRISGSLVRPEALGRLGAAGLRTIIDLRGAGEDRSVVEQWTRREGVRYVNHPIGPGGPAEGVARLLRRALESGREEDYVRRIYAAIVDKHGMAIAATIGALAEALPAGFGCAAGKDRTGVVNACLHVLLGASEDDAADFYATHAPELERLRPLAAGWLGYSDADELPPGLDVLLGVRRSTIVEALERIRLIWGGVEPYLEAHGLTPERAELVRGRLVVS